MSVPTTFSSDLSEDTSSEASASHLPRGLALYSKLLVIAVFGLILKGALVTSNAAGLAVPDWPTSFGENMFLFPPSKWKGIIFYEHVHRLLASGVGLMTVILAVWVSLRESRRHVLWLAWLAVVVVVAQGILGGLTVLHLLPPAISSAHGVLAQTFLLITIAIAACYSTPSAARRGDSVIWKAALALLALAYVQLTVGAYMRHSGAGLAVPDFPTMGGALLPSADLLSQANAIRRTMMLPPVEAYQVSLHLVHRFLGVALFFIVAAVVWKFRSRARMSGLAGTLHLLLTVTFIQVALGIFTVLWGRDPLITSLHVMTGAAFLASVFLLLLRSYARGVR